jgi:hypothetical protein
MFKGVARLESIVEGKIGHFFVDNDTQLNHVKEMLFQFLKYVGSLEDQAKAQADAAKAAEESTAEKVVVPEVVEVIEQPEEPKVE